MNKIMILSCCTISLIGILGLNLIDSYAQHAPPIKQIQSDAKGRGGADDVPNPEPIAPGDNHRGK